MHRCAGAEEEIAGAKRPRFDMTSVVEENDRGGGEVSGEVSAEKTFKLPTRECTISGENDKGGEEVAGEVSLEEIVEFPPQGCDVAGGNDGGVELTVEEIVEFPPPGCTAPASIGFSPDDGVVSYLFSPDATLDRKLFVFDIHTGRRDLAFAPPEGGGLGEGNLSAVEKLRRERARERGLGVTRYEWRAVRPRAPSGDSRKHVIMVPLPSGVYVQELGSDAPDLKLPSVPGSPIIDPHLSPDGSLLAFVRDDELHVLNLFGGEAKQLTFGARGNHKTHGLAEYIAQEEMDRKTGFWWSPDSKQIAFVEVDSNEIPLFRIVHQGKNFLGVDAQEDHAYPFAGAANVTVRLGVVSVEGNLTWMDLLCGGSELGKSDGEYLARVNWTPDNSLVAQVLHRSHTSLKILKFNTSTGEKEVLLEESNEIWINLHDCFTPLDKAIDKFTGGFIWASERTGFRHLYIHDRYGSLLGPITQGAWMVEQIAGVNENLGIVYFTGTADGPLESNLYSAKLFPDWETGLAPPKRLTLEKGRHVVVLDHKMQRFVDVHDSLTQPPRVLIRSLLDGSLLMAIYEPPFRIPRLVLRQVSPPEIVEVRGGDRTTLYAAMYKPDERRFGPPPYRTLISVYGGPGVQTVYDSWVNTVDMRAQYLRSKGFLVWKLDNRGSWRRGLEFEGHLKGKIGRIDAEDQLCGAEWLIKQGLAKEGRIGLYGWSYGGFLSAMALARFPGAFRCAVSGAPVTAWDGYDTFYTEKYMGRAPEEIAGGAYDRASVVSHVGGLKGKLLLVHGMIDENVHFRHTARLVNALIGARKPYELMVFPDERHMPRRIQDRVYMEERMWEFVERNL